MNYNLLELDNLSEKEKEIALKILNDLSNGNSKSFNQLKYADFKEIPVDIETFITDDRYLGKAWKDNRGNLKIYPYWLKRLKELFPDNITTNYNNAIFTGARGLGKSEVAVTCGLYLMYRLMCLKDPHEYLHLKSTEKVAFAFMNITISLAEEIGVTKFQATVKSSPWFLERGTLSGRGEQRWNPPEWISIIIGSQATHVIGQPVYFCLDGDTIISTEFGDKKINELVDCDIRVKSVDDNGNIILSDSCTVKETAESYDEYEIELEDGSIVRCTPNHRLMLKDGSYKEAKDLTCDDELFDVDLYGYVYKTTNNVNGKIYIGQKKSKIYLQENYLGSGKLIRKSINKYGVDNFSNELLCWCLSKEELDFAEKYYISLYNSTDSSIGYNISDGAQGGNLGDKVNAKISKSLIGHTVSKETKLKISEKNKGRKLTSDQRKKISKANKGRKVSEQTRQKMSESAKLVDRSNFKYNTGKVCITNGDEIKFVDKNITMPDGWFFGNCKASKKRDMSRYYSNDELRKLKSLSLSGDKNPMFGKGYKLSGGKNGKATKDYWYNDLYFDCRKSLVQYLKTIDNKISLSLIRSIENNSFGARTIKKYSWLIEALKWEFKDEN